MSNQQPKRHHTVPQFMLREIAAEDGTLFAYDRRTPDRGVFSERFQKLFVEKHFYSYELEDGRKDPRPEQFLSELESNAAPVFKRVIHAARQGRLEDLSRQDRGAMTSFMYFQWKRSPDTISTRMLDAFDTEIDQGLERFEREHRPITQAERASFASPDFRQRMRRNARVGATVGAGGEALQAIAKTGLHVVRIAHARKSFAIGSRPVAKLTLPGDTVIGSPNVEFWMPIAFDVALVWCGPSVYRLVQCVDAALIRNTNLSIARQSTVVAARAAALVKSLIMHEPVIQPVSKLPDGS
jgi:hypothetical protein